MIPTVPQLARRIRPFVRFMVDGSWFVDVRRWLREKARG